MKSLNYKLRKISPEMMSLLKIEAERQNISINSLVLLCIEKALGIGCTSQKILYHDLDHLAGTWNQEDEEFFKKNINAFEVIDKFVQFD